jgi:hypothetical protein
MEKLVQGVYNSFEIVWNCGGGPLDKLWRG